MTRRFGIDLSHFQSPVAPAGNPWPKLSERSSFCIVRATYGAWPDPAAFEHVHAARLEAMQVGLYHFFCVKQSLGEQLDHFLAQAVDCGIGKGDILPALDVEDDGPNKIGPSWAPLVKRAIDELTAEFGGAMIYITQAGWAQMGKPDWLPKLPLWVAHYTNAPAPATPGNAPFTIWQSRVGPYNPGAPFVAKEAYLADAIDQNVADMPLPLCTMNPSAPNSLPAVGPEPPSREELLNRRLWDKLTHDLYGGLDLNADKDVDFGDGLGGKQHDTDPSELSPESSR